MSSTNDVYSIFSDYYSQSSFFIKSSIAYIIIILGLLYTVRSRPSSSSSLHKVPSFVLKGRSNLHDEFEYSAEQKKEQTYKVKSLWIYPVKGCRGIELERSDIVATGLQYDRQLMFACRKSSPNNDAEWSFASQRGYPKMALLKTSISPCTNTVTITYPVSASHPFASSTRTFTVPLNVNLLPDNEKKKLKITPVEIWGDIYQTYDISYLIPQECKTTIFDSEKKKVEVSLFGVYDGNPRIIETKCTPKVEVLGRNTVTGFADIYPVHILGLASVRALNNFPSVKKEVPYLSARRFRPNIIVEGCNAFDEDDWAEIEIGGDKGKYHVVAHTPRCKVPNNDPNTGIRNMNEPDVSIRRERNIDEGFKVKGCMGMHMVPWVETKEVKVGDVVEVKSRTVVPHVWG